MKKIIIFSIFAVPIASIIVIQGTIVWYPQFLMLLLIGCAVASFYIWNFNKPLAVLAMYCSLSSVFICQQNSRAVLCLLMMFVGIALICAVSQLKSTKTIYQAIIAMSLIQFALVILQLFNVDPFFVNTLSGFAGSSNQLGVYYAGITPLMGMLFPFAFIAIFFSHCSSAFIGAVAGCFVYLLFTRAKFLLLLLLALAICCLFYQKFDSPLKPFKERVSIWQLTLKQVITGKANMKINDNINHIVTANPLFGFGLGSFIQISPLTQEEALFKGVPVSQHVNHRYEHAHNDLVEANFDLGLLFNIIIIWLISDILDKFIKFKDDKLVLRAFSALVAFGVTSMGVYVLHAPLSYFMCCLTVGLFYAEVKRCEEERLGSHVYY